MEAARELLATNPEKAATLITGSILKRLDALEGQTKFLMSKYLGSDALKNYPQSRPGGPLKKDDFDFAIKYGSDEDIAAAVRNTGLGYAEMKSHFFPAIRKRPDAEKIIQRLRELNVKEENLRGGKTYRRKHRGAKHTRRA